MEQVNSPNDNWYFYHIKSKKRLGPFSVKALSHLIIESKINLDQILVCKIGWPKWKRPTDDVEFFNEFQKVIQTNENLLPPIEEDIPIPQVQIKNKKEDETKTQIVLEKPQLKIVPSNVQIEIHEKKIESPEIKPEKMIANETVHSEEKYSVELKVILISDKKSYRTKTVHLSTDGLHIEEKLPEHYLERPIDLYLYSPDLKLAIKFHAEHSHHQNGLTHLKFKKVHESALKHLESWIAIDTKNHNFKKIA